MTDREAMKLALEALEMLARYENPETRVQVRKPKDGGPIVTMYPHKVAIDAADALRTAIEQAEKPVAWADEIIEDLHALYNSEMITENDSGDALIRLDAAICAVEEAEERHTTPPAAQRQWVGLTDEAKAVIDAARAAMDESTEAYDSEGSIKIASQLAASLSLCLDEYDRAIEAKLKEKNHE
jgi:hypothetical protein